MNKIRKVATDDAVAANAQASGKASIGTKGRNGKARVAKISFFRDATDDLT